MDFKKDDKVKIIKITDETHEFEIGDVGVVVDIDITAKYPVILSINDIEDIGVKEEEIELIKENDNMSKRDMLKEIKELQLKINQLQEKIKEEDVQEDIATAIVNRMELINMSQHISRDKIKLKSHDEKNSMYNITYKRKGRKIVCEFSSGIFKGVGIAKCSPEDEFDYGKGVVLAELRARSDFYKKASDFKATRM